MSNYFQNNQRAFGRDFQNIFNFLNKPNNIKKVSINENIENPTQIFKKSKQQKNNPNRRNTMYMKFSSFPLQNMNNISKVNKDNKSTLCAIKEEKENDITQTRKTMINFNDAGRLSNSPLILINGNSSASVEKVIRYSKKQAKEIFNSIDLPDALKDFNIHQWNEYANRDASLEDVVKEYLAA